MRARRTDDAPVAHSLGTDDQESTDGSDQKGVEGVEEEENAPPAIGSSFTAVGPIIVAGTTTSVGDSTTVLGPATATVKSVGDSPAVLVLVPGTATVKSVDDSPAIHGSAISTDSAASTTIDKKDGATTPDRLLADNGTVFFSFLLKN